MTRRYERWTPVILIACLGISPWFSGISGAGITAPAKKIAFVFLVEGTHAESNEQYTRALLEDSAKKAGYDVIDQAKIVRAMNELGLSSKANFYTDTAGPKHLLQIGHKVGAHLVCSNTLEVKAGSVGRFLYKDKKVNANLQYIVVDARTNTKLEQDETRKRKDKKNKLGAGLSFLVLAGGGYLTNVKISKEEKAAIDACVDDAYEWLAKAVKQGTPIK